MDGVKAPLSTDEQLASAAHRAVTEFVNGRHCNSKADVEQALRALQLMVGEALYLVINGKMEKLS